VDLFAEARPDLPIALHIASAGYGIIEAHELVVPYDAVMGSGVREWQRRGQHLRMPERARLLVESCALAIIALSRPYLTGAAVRSLRPDSGYCVVISAEDFGSSDRVKTLLAGRQQARVLGTTDREVGSVVLERLLARIASEGPGVVAALPSESVEWATD
jgi:hypothetical protein